MFLIRKVGGDDVAVLLSLVSFHKMNIMSFLKLPADF
jgi:hypothetical protein